ncbi:MAG: hypothetical protein M3453_01990 [Pseudomonadota bacterium]|nr:hypothetical protein [Pseudomonadota bacterium]
MLVPRRPDRQPTGRELLNKLQAEHAGAYPDGEIRGGAEGLARADRGDQCGRVERAEPTRAS